jgi:NADH dehydrogenase FAD-containing subunit
MEQRLKERTDIEVTLVNRDNFFLFTPMLHEVAASDLELTTIVNPVRKLLRKVQVFSGDVERVDLEKRLLTLSHGFQRHSHTVNYDHLIVALGSIANFHNLPRPLGAFSFQTLGQLAAIGQRAGVAEVLGMRFSGFAAWWLWRTIYLAKLPGWDRKVRVALQWTLDLLFRKDCDAVSYGTRAGDIGRVRRR